MVETLRDDYAECVQGYLDTEQPDHDDMRAQLLGQQIRVRQWVENRMGKIAKLDARVDRARLARWNYSRAAMLAANDSWSEPSEWYSIFEHLIDTLRTDLRDCMEEIRRLNELHHEIARFARTLSPNWRSGPLSDAETAEIERCMNEVRILLSKSKLLGVHGTENMNTCRVSKSAGRESCMDAHCPLLGLYCRRECGQS